jgi:hypothetical protein
MRVHKRIPATALRNADIFGSRNLKRTERVVDLETNVEIGPNVGTVVLKESTILNAAHKLGYVTMLQETYDAEQAEYAAEMDRLRADSERLHQLEGLLTNG